MDRQVLIESFRDRERAALKDLAAIAGGRSVCSISRQGASISRQGAPVPEAKYHEGAAAALAEARRAIEAVADGHDGGQSARAALLDVRARWLAQSRTRGRTGPDWTRYLAGGLDALEQMIDDDGGLDALDPRN
jgi:hypothetical protein